MTTQRTNREAGVASMIVTLIVIIITSLIVLGFAQSARRNQREALDRQVSAQAYYAAETGVNDAVVAIKQQLATPPGTVASNTNCATSAAYVGRPTTNLDQGTSYTCLIVNPSPSKLLYSLVSQGKSTVVPIRTDDPISKMVVSWKASGTISRNPANCNASNLNLPTQAAWACDYGLMRLDLVKYGSDFSADTLTDNSATIYLKPSASASNLKIPTLSDPDQRAFVNPVACDSSTGTCQATIEFTGDQQRQYFMRMTSMYRDSGEVTLSALDSSNNSQELYGAQATIDSTGKSQDQLRRISVRLPLQATNNNDLYPTNALQTANSICKRFPIAAGSLDNPSNLCQP